MNNEWLRVIDEALVTHHLDVANEDDDYETARKKMNSLLSLNQDYGANLAKEKFAPVIESAKAVIQRWDSPLWRQESTAELINRLRSAIEVFEKENGR